MLSSVFTCARNQTWRRRNPVRGSEQLRLGNIRQRRAVIAEHVLNFGAIRVGERGICSKRNATVEVIPRAV
jgi:hypothetical protein